MKAYFIEQPWFKLYHIHQLHVVINKIYYHYSTYNIQQCQSDDAFSEQLTNQL